MRIIFALILFSNSQAPAQNNNNPVADPRAVVKSENARFTLLTSQVIRLEWDSLSKFEDHASQVVVNRKLPVPAFTRSDDKGWLVLKTNRLTLKYLKGSGKFNRDNLVITLENGHEWKPGQKNKDNLKGTARTLDGYRGDVNYKNPENKLDLGEGLLSKDGWFVIDDSKSFLFDESSWNWAMPRQTANSQDWYFMGYGKDFKSALMDYTKIGGKVPMPPRYAFGYWWSRYWNYSDNELRDLVTNFSKYDLPLDVIVVDMDWHTTDSLSWHPDKRKIDEFGERKGWTGYTFNKTLFPDPAKFLNWTKDQQLKTTI